MLTGRLLELVSLPAFKAGQLEAGHLELLESLLMSAIGILQAVSLTRVFDHICVFLMLKWFKLFPEVLKKTIEHPKIVKAVLKVMQEFLHVPTGLLNYRFEYSQCLFLFGIVREVQCCTMNYVANIGSVCESEVYERKYVPMKYMYKMILHLIMGKTLTQNLATECGEHFDVFFGALMRLFISTPEDDLFSYPRKLKSGFEFVTAYLENFPASFARTVSREDFARTANVLKDGCLSIHQHICISCHAAFEAVFNNYTRQVFSLEYVSGAQGAFELLLARSLTGLINGEAQNQVTVSRCLFKVFAFLKGRAKQIMAEILTRYGSELRKDVRQCIEGLGMFAECEIRDDKGRKQFVQAVKVMLELVKVTDEMITN